MAKVTEQVTERYGYEKSQVRRALIRGALQEKGRGGDQSAFERARSRSLRNVIADGLIDLLKTKTYADDPVVTTLKLLDATAWLQSR
ncbi:MAG: hypothetical protein HY791_15820 [Deltaproteobacteria bacterium]|nr:hypothetical protein [Deltaproteobacteria bacterium]